MAGAAAGTVFGGPIGGAIGAAVGGFVGGLAYDIIDAIPAAADNPAARVQITLRQQGEARNAVLDELAQSCGTSREEQRQALVKWGYEPLCVNPPTCRNDWNNYLLANGEEGTYALFNENSRKFFEAAAAQAAYCATKQQARSNAVKLHAPPSGSSATKIVVTAAAAAGGIWLLAKLF